MTLSAAEEKEILEGVRQLSKGAPMYGIPPVPVGVARLLFHLEGIVVDNLTEKPALLELKKKIDSEGHETRVYIRDKVLPVLDQLPNKIIAALPPAAAGGLSMEDVRGAVRTEIVELFGPIFDGIGS